MNNRWHPSVVIVKYPSDEADLFAPKAAIIYCNFQSGMNFNLARQILASFIKEQKGTKALVLDAEGSALSTSGRPPDNQIVYVAEKGCSIGPPLDS